MLDSVVVQTAHPHRLISAAYEVSAIQSLERQPQTWIRNYGPGNSALLSLQGSSSQQSLLTWNQIPIQHPMLGTADLSLVPLDLFDKVTIRQIGSAQIGNSGFGGVLDLSTHLSGQPYFQMGIEAASFETLRAQAQWNAKNNQSNLNLKLSHESSQNDFPVLKSGMTTPLTNSQFRRHHAMLDYDFLYNSKHSFEGRLWLGSGQRDLAPLTTQERSEASQEDQIIRSLIGWRYQGKGFHQIIRAGLLRDYIHFIDPVAQLSARSTVYNGYAQSSSTWTWKRNTMASSYRLHSIQANINSYESTQHEWRGSWNTSHQYFWSNGYILTELGISHRDDQISPLNPSWTLSWSIVNNLRLQTQIRHDFRFPTFNDLYWINGGSASIQPEYGWSEYVGAEWIEKHSNWSKKTEVQAFHRHIKNWIQWAPGANSPIWTAQNLTEVRSYGYSIHQTQDFSFGSHRLSLNAQYDWTRSIHLESRKNPRFVKGEQLIYTPEHQWQAGIQYNHKSVKLFGSVQNVSSQNGVNETIEGFTLIDAGISYKVPLKSYSPSKLGEGKVPRLTLTARIYNLTDEQYVVVERRYMPGRNFSLQLNLQI